MSRQLQQQLDDLAQRVARVESATASLFADVDPGPDELNADDHTRAELDQLAADAGVDAPSSLPNKAAVIDAIAEARQ